MSSEPQEEGLELTTDLYVSAIRQEDYLRRIHYWIRFMGVVVLVQVVAAIFIAIAYLDAD